MPHQNHNLEIYEPYEYDGPNPLCAEGIGLLSGPGGTRYYLLNLPDPVQFEHESVQQLLVQCRYSGDKIERPTSTMCTVNISRVRPGISLQLNGSFNFADVIRWGVGKITLSEHH